MFKHAEDLHNTAQDHSKIPFQNSTPQTNKGHKPSNGNDLVELYPNPGAVVKETQRLGSLSTANHHDALFTPQHIA